MGLNSEVFFQGNVIKKAQRADQKNQSPCILWFTGLSGSGKSTLAKALDEKFFELNLHTYMLDGDNLRCGLNKDLGFSDSDRRENIRRAGELSALLVDAGLIVLAAFISPFRGDRQLVRELVGPDEFIEIFVATPLLTCRLRDPKGLYKKACSGEIRNFTGIGSDYEAPINPDLIIDTNNLGLEESLEVIFRFLRKRGVL